MDKKFEFIKKEDWSDVAWVARFMELLSLDQEFLDKMGKDPEGTLKEYKFPLSVEDVEFEPIQDTIHLDMKAVHKGSKAEKYAAFMNKKFEHVEYIKKKCAPENPAMKKWRERQIGRTSMELGAKVTKLIHAPFTIELADGCSIGCEFCGLNAGRLKSVFRYTDENAKLFNDVISIAKEIIGDAAGQGTMYFATEPLDNPDYELFLADYLKCFDELPQITTAAAMRHKDRMHALLTQLNERNDKIYRFSVLSKEILWQIMEEFTPEELALVELLPQYEEAPSNAFVNAGRNGDKNNEYGDTISCLSGFVVNMCRRVVRLTTPTYASSKHPTGEIIFAEEHFETAEDFREILTSMIKKYMKNIIGPNVGFKIRDGVKYEAKDDKVIVSCAGGCEYRFETGNSTKIYLRMLEELNKGYIKRRDIVIKLRQMDECRDGRTDILFYILNRLWSAGIIVAENGEV